MKTKVNQMVLLFLGVVLAAMSSGCALGDRNIALMYKPVKSMEDKPETNIEWAKSVNIAITKFQDSRTITEVGEVRNAYGMKTAKVYAKNQDVGSWVANAIAEELAVVGFEVTKYNDIAPPNVEVSITGTVTEAYTKMYLNSTATIRAKIDVAKANVPVLSKEYIGTKAVLAMFVSTGEYESAMQGALQDMMKKCIPDIIKAIQ